MLWITIFAFLATCFATSSPGVLSPPKPSSVSDPGAKSMSSISSCILCKPDCSFVTPECPERCRPTCKVPNPKNCDSYEECYYCGKGSVWDEENRKCVLVESCPYGVGCNGDPNASIRLHPSICPSTCSLPNEKHCLKVGPVVGCECNLGYIFSKEDGVCIGIDDCPGGNPCGVNGTYSYCVPECTPKFCPVDDNFREVCDPWEFKTGCRRGCVCKDNHLWKSNLDRTCILAKECPKIQCRRQHEEWDPCPPPCFSDSCYKLSDQPITCTELDDPQKPPECKPRCRCKTGYARDICTNICKPTKDCAPHPVRKVYLFK